MRIITGDGGKLAFFQDRYEDALTKNSELYEKLDKHYQQYKGSKEIDYISGSNATPARAENCRNVTYELIESQVSGQLPSPYVTPKMHSSRNERNAKSIETLIKNKLDELPFEKLNDIDERYSPIYGGSIWLVEWDNSIMTHNTVGDIKVTCLSPKHFVGQPYIYDVNEMEYCFITFDTTKEDIMRRYGVSPEVADETKSDNEDDDDSATLIVCFYKNEEDKICQYVWSGDTELLDIDNYYARKRKRCTKCGKPEALCNCDDPAFEEGDEEFEDIERYITLSDGSVIEPQSVMIENGQVVMEMQCQQYRDESGPVSYEDTDGVIKPFMVEVPVPKMQPTRIPFYQPKTMPIVIRKNTSEEDNLLGQSDCEFIRDQQQSINKIETRIMQKLMRGGVKAKVPDDYAGEIDNGILDDCVKVTQSNNNLFGTLDLQADVSRDTEQSERLYDQAKRILGISDSFQGQYDPSAKSGVAKQEQIRQAAGRLNSKRQMKNACYAEVFRIIYELYLAYADEPRPATYKDANGQWQNVMFNRYDFVIRDEAGEYYYDDEYLFRAEVTVDVERQRELLWQENRQNFSTGAYGDPHLPQTQLIFWRNMESLHYPFATDNVTRITEEIRRQAEIAQYQEQIANKDQQIGQMSDEIAGRIDYEQYLKDQYKKVTENGGNTNA